MAIAWKKKKKSPATYTAVCARSRHHLYSTGPGNRAFWKHSINYDAHYTSHISNSHQPFFFFSFLMLGVQVMVVQKCGTPDTKTRCRSQTGRELTNVPEASARRRFGRRVTSPQAAARSVNNLAAQRWHAKKKKQKRWRQPSTVKPELWSERVW